MRNFYKINVSTNTKLTKRIIHMTQTCCIPIHAHSIKGTIISIIITWTNIADFFTPNTTLQCIKIFIIEWYVAKPMPLMHIYVTTPKKKSA